MQPDVDDACRPADLRSIPMAQALSKSGLTSGPAGVHGMLKPDSMRIELDIDDGHGGMRLRLWGTPKAFVGRWAPRDQPLYVPVNAGTAESPFTRWLVFHWVIDSGNKRCFELRGVLPEDEWPPHDAHALDHVGRPGWPVTPKPDSCSGSAEER